MAGVARQLWGLLIGVIVAGCTSPPSAAVDRPAVSLDTPSANLTGQPSRTLTMVVRYEVIDLAAKTLGSNGPANTDRLFNAALALTDGTGAVRPYLAEALPQLNTDGWRVFPDGEMETTYKLRPGLTWHDGAPLSADDFVFAWRVYSNPLLNIFEPKPQDLMELVTAPDSRTIVIRWRSPYPGAGALINTDLDALPRHILEQPYAALSTATLDAFVNLPYWTTEFVGLGPFRLERWEPGAQIEGSAFGGHSLGRPKIDRAIVRVVGDENTALTNLLADNVQFAVQLSLRFEHALVLKRDWVAPGRGVVHLFPGSSLAGSFQFRPEFLQSQPLMDVRVRKALAHTVDKEDLNLGLFDGQGIIGHTFVAPGSALYADVDNAIAKYPFDPRRTEQLMVDAGFTRDRESFFADATGERFRPSFWVTSGSQFERQLALMTDTWRKAGIDVQPYILPVAQGRDNQARSTYPGILQNTIGFVPTSAENFTTGQIGTAATRWAGSNRGGWSNAEYDRLWQSANGTLDQSQRNQLVVRMLKTVSEELPTLMFYHNLGVIAHVSQLRGPQVGVPDTLVHWNIHEWEFVG